MFGIRRALAEARKTLSEAGAKITALNAENTQYLNDILRMRAALENILDCVERHGGSDMVVKPTKELFGRQVLMTELIRETLKPSK